MQDTLVLILPTLSKRGYPIPHIYKETVLAHTGRPVQIALCIFSHGAPINVEESGDAKFLLL